MDHEKNLQAPGAVIKLSVRSIAKSFKQRRVVDGVTFDVSAGQIVGLLGPNGAGKTTSFYMVVGLVSPDEGDIRLGSDSIRQLPMYQRARVGLSYLPQEASIFRRLTVVENIIVALEAHGVSGAAKSEKLEFLLKEFSIEHIRDSYGFALSGGERRRVEIARALAGDPKFILLDEPFAGIDPIAVADIQGIIRKLKDSGIGILITDHNVRETLGICDYAYIMKDGKVQVQGAAQEVASSDLAKRFYLGENFKL
jgi:lipopolysaccharide export system ATP-binding protein